MTLIDARNAVTSSDDIERGLMALAVAGDNSLRASKASGIPSSTLRLWRKNHAQRYEEIRTQRAPQIEQLISQEARAIAVRLAQIENKAIDAAEAQIADADLKDLSTLIKTAAISKGVNVDKFLILDGRPTSISEHRSRDDIFRELEREGMIEGTATEVPRTAFVAEAGKSNLSELDAGDPPR